MEQTRVARSITVAVDTLLADADPIPYEHAAGGSVIIPAAASGLTGITWYASDSKEGTYYPCYDSSNTAVSSTVAHTQSNLLPDALYGSRFLKGVGNIAASVIIVTKT